MKKTVVMILVVILSGFGGTSLAYVYPDMPQWSEFCPKNYLDVKVDAVYHMPDKQYWADRKKSFEQSKHFCINNYSYDFDKMEECFSSLKSSEKHKTQEFEKIQKYKYGNPIYH